MWQPIETAPIDEDFLVWDGSTVSMGQRGSSGRIYYWNDPAPHSIIGATHWMPLPEPPLAAAPSAA